MYFSQRISQPELNEISYAEQIAVAAGEKLRNLSDSNPTRHGLVSASWAGTYMADPRGEMQAREILASYLEETQGRKVDPENLYLLSSTSEAYAWLIKLFCDPGEKILAPRPGYPLVAQLAQLESVECIPYYLYFAGEWFIDIAELRQKLLASSSSTALCSPRALVVINPNNPTGSYIKSTERKQILELCQEYELPLIADEVFFAYSFAAVSSTEEIPRSLEDIRRLAGEKSVLTFALDGFSKNLAAPQIKFAWIEISGPAELVEAAKQRLDMIADAYLPMSSLITSQLPQLLVEMPIQQQNIKKRIALNLQNLQRLVAESSSGALSLYNPAGGWNALLRFPTYLEENMVVVQLIKRLGVTAQPGYFFDFSTPGFLNISLLLEPQILLETMRKVVEVFDDLILHADSDFSSN